MDSIYSKKYHKSFTLKKTNSTRFDYEYKFSIEELMELAKLAEYTNPAQQILIEDSATCILKKVLDYANRNVLKNFNLSLQQEPRRIVN
jgi:hypothetical protein